MRLSLQLHIVMVLCPNRLGGCYNSEIGKLAVSNDDLREKVRQHKLNFFNAAWKKFDEAVPGSLFVVPTGDLLAIVQRDYLAMQEMITGDVPKFEDIVRSLAELESLINEQVRDG